MAFVGPGTSKTALGCEDGFNLCTEALAHVIVDANWRAAYATFMMGLRRLVFRTLQKVGPIFAGGVFPVTGIQRRCIAT